MNAQKIAAQVAVEAVVNMPDAYSPETVEAVREAGMTAGVAPFYMDMLPPAGEGLAIRVTAETFADHYAGARMHTRIAQATSEFEATHGARYYLSADMLSGYVVRADGELTNVWSVERGRGDVLVTDAVANGATHLDCFDGYLTSLYARNGFERVTSLPNWSPDGPDVVYMATPGNYARALDRAEQDAR